MTNKYIYDQEEIFHEIDGDDNNILMTIPEEILKQMNWKPGDSLRINQDEDGVITITKVNNE